MSKKGHQKRRVKFVHCFSNKTTCIDLLLQFSNLFIPCSIQLEHESNFNSHYDFSQQSNLYLLYNVFVSFNLHLSQNYFNPFISFIQKFIQRPFQVTTQKRSQPQCGQKGRFIREPCKFSDPATFGEASVMMNCRSSLSDSHTSQVIA